MVGMKKYWRYFIANLANIFEYRAVPLTWAIIELITVASGIFFWLAVYRGQDKVGSFGLEEMMAYYILIPLVGSFTYVHLVNSLPGKIKDGQISTDLVKPYSLSAAMFFKALGSTIFKLLSKLPIFLSAAVFLFYFLGVSLNPGPVFLAILVSLLAFVLHVFLDLSLSFLAFWLDDIWAFEHLKLVMLMIFGGMTFPLALLPEGLKTVFNLLPFRFIYYFPISVALGSLSLSELLKGVFQILGWIFFFYLFSKILWHRGLKKYGAYGN